MSRLRNLLMLLLLLSPLATPAAPALAEQTAATKPTPITIGIFPRRNAVLTSELFSPLVEYLSRRLGREVRLMTAKDFPAFWKGVEDGRYDVVHYNQYHYVLTADRYRVIAHNEEFGLGTLRGAIYVRRDSGIDRLGQLRGKTILFGGGTDAMMAYIVPRYLLLQAGLKSGDFSERFATSPPNAVLGAFYRQADGAGAGDVVIEMPAVTKAIDVSQLKIIATSEPIHHLPWVVRRDMPPALAERIHQLITTLGDTPEGRAVLEAANLSGIAAANDSDYDQCRKIIREVLPDAPVPQPR